MICTNWASSCFYNKIMASSDMKLLMKKKKKPGNCKWNKLGPLTCQKDFVTCT